MILKLSSASSIFLLAYGVLIIPAAHLLLSSSKAFILELSLIEVSTCNLNLMLILDQISLSFSGVICIISGCVLLFSSSYMASDLFLKRFVWLVILFVLSMNFLIFISSLPALLLGWDGLGITSFVLVGYYQNYKSLSASMLTILANRVGDVMILLAIGVMVVQGHWNIFFTFDFLMDNLKSLSFMVLIAAMTKSAQIPFSSWLPAAMAAPTPVSALVHSSTLVTAGVFLLIRFYPSLVGSIHNSALATLYFMSIMTMLMAGVAANYENDLKKIIALSTLSQLGLMMMTLALKMPYLALFHLYTHAMFKALLFLCAGAIIHNESNTQDIRDMGEIWKDLPFITACMNIANLCLCGSPFMSGFYSKDLILELTLLGDFSTLMILLTFLAIGLTTSYSLRLSLRSLWAPRNSTPLHFKFSKDLYINWACFILAFSAVMAGMYLQLVFINFSPSFFMSTSTKMIPLIAVIFGLMFTFIFWVPNPQLSLKMNKSRFFLSTMWFLTPLSSQPTSKYSLLLATNTMKSLDHGWLEVVGGGGAFTSLKILVLVNQLIQSKNINFFVTTMLFFLLLTLAAYSSILM
uniref:NADH-ubiquinone oxidoreductase chain 5 n=1 Tax=Obscurella hidalgoi TaxID=1663726 RepID=A0A0M3WMG1_OBSHI|nr:NADH dehydrogenase subunit 5 [Obscurella hidalgoi]AKL90680.1 NADH dehydrogenase subunit 5 [Obscurella hidalgoi]